MLTVNVTLDELVQQVPSSVDGVPVEVRVAGPVRPLAEGAGSSGPVGSGAAGGAGG